MLFRRNKIDWLISFVKIINDKEIFYGFSQYF